MAIEFNNDHGIAGIDIKQDGNYIACIRYGRLYGYTVTCEEGTNLDIEELEQILSKMKELQGEVKS